MMIRKRPIRASRAFPQSEKCYYLKKVFSDGPSSFHQVIHHKHQQTGGRMRRISTVSITLKPASPVTMTSSKAAALGPYLQGALLERADTRYVALLHQLPFNPYSQYCCIDEKGNIVWKINTLTDEAAEQLIEPIRSLEQVGLRATGESFDVVSTSLNTIDIKCLLDSIYEDGPSKIKVQFLTPAAFKSQGSYVFMPTVRLVFQNLLMRYYQAYEGNKEVDAETIDFIEQNVRVTSYCLQSRYFSHIAPQGKKIPAFVGNMTLSISGPSSLAGLARMLLTFGEYSGVGIKTSMGMGGITCS